MVVEASETKGGENWSWRSKTRVGGCTGTAAVGVVADTALAGKDGRGNAGGGIGEGKERDETEGKGKGKGKGGTVGNGPAAEVAGAAGRYSADKPLAEGVWGNTGGSPGEYATRTAEGAKGGAEPKKEKADAARGAGIGEAKEGVAAVAAGGAENTGNTDDRGTELGYELG